MLPFMSFSQYALIICFLWFLPGFTCKAFSHLSTSSTNTSPYVAPIHSKNTKKGQKQNFWTTIISSFTIKVNQHHNKNHQSCWMSVYGPSVLLWVSVSCLKPQIVRLLSCFTATLQIILLWLSSTCSLFFHICARGHICPCANMYEA